MGTTGADVTAVSHGTTVATNQLLRGRSSGSGSSPPRATSSSSGSPGRPCPTVTGSSHFWVKPPRIVPADLVKTVGGRLDVTGAEVRPFDESRAVGWRGGSVTGGIDTLGVCFLHSYANPEHRLAMREVLRREHPDAVVSISSDVLRGTASTSAV